MRHHLLAFLLLGAGCTSASSTINAPPDAGDHRAIDAPFAEVVAAMPSAIRGAGFELHEQWTGGSEDATFIGIRRSQFVNRGYYLRARVVRLSHSKTDVYVLTKLRMSPTDSNNAGLLGLITPDEDRSALVFRQLSALLSQREPNGKEFFAK